MAVAGFVKEKLGTPKNPRFPYDPRSGLAHEKENDMGKRLIGILVLVLLTGCASMNPLVKASPDQLRQYPTDRLVQFELSHSKGFDPEVSQELDRRISEDIQDLILNATTLTDFESSRFSFQTETMASKIRKKYEIRERSGISHQLNRNWNQFFSDARRQWFVNTHPDISNEIRECILNSKSEYQHSLKFGMTEDQVAAAIGPPNDINRSSGSWGVREQWVYGGMINRTYFRPHYFYFTNGILTSMQD